MQTELEKALIRLAARVSAAVPNDEIDAFLTDLRESPCLDSSIENLIEDRDVMRELCNLYESALVTALCVRKA